jgi:hypothetical protein
MQYREFRHRPPSLLNPPLKGFGFSNAMII